MIPVTILCPYCNTWTRLNAYDAHVAEKHPEWMTGDVLTKTNKVGKGYLVTKRVMVKV